MTFNRFIFWRFAFYTYKPNVAISHRNNELKGVGAEGPGKNYVVRCPLRELSRWHVHSDPRVQAEVRTTTWRKVIDWLSDVTIDREESDWIITSRQQHVTNPMGGDYRTAPTRRLEDHWNIMNTSSSRATSERKIERGRFRGRHQYAWKTIGKETMTSWHVRGGGGVLTEEFRDVTQHALRSFKIKNAWAKRT